jgi:aminoglycoside phosphotransferase (APT) family kinase protein
MRPYASGADNKVLAARTTDGRNIVVKVPRGPGSRYGTAAWASAALTAHDVPAPQILWHDSWDGGAACVETRCAGLPLTGAARRLHTTGSVIGDQERQAARHVGTLLRRVHSVTVGGYGRLTANGTGRHPSLESSILAALSPQPGADPAARLTTLARRLVADNLWRLRDPGPRLLLGDCAARHVFYDPATGQVTGFIDLESARGGDPMADLAGFSLREHPGLTRELIKGYFPEGATSDHAWALTVHRSRIAAHLMMFHLARGEYQPARHLAGLLAADMRAITTRAPAVMPAQPPSSRQRPLSSQP